MKLALKLPLAFAAALLLMFASAIYGIVSLNHCINQYNTSVAQNVANERLASAMLTAFKLQVQEWKDTLLRGKDPAKRDKYWSAFAEREKTVDDQARDLLAKLPEGQSRTLIEQFASAHQSMGNGYRKGFDAFTAAGFDPTAGDTAVAGVDREPSRLLEQAAQEIAAQSASESGKAARNAEHASIISIVLMVIAFAAGLTGAWFFSRAITSHLNRAVSFAGTIAAGNLCAHIDDAGKDEIGDLMMSLKEMQTSLATIVTTVRHNAVAVSTASSQIAAGNLSLSSRTEQQAASLEQTAASMEELTSTVRMNSDNARNALSLASHASDTATRGGEVMGQVIETMSGISKSASQVADILGVIDSIAFQTNILALNAAVEAARAGEQGRGFAVVASEVRALAQRSASAAKEIKALIDQSSARVDAGTQFVTGAGEIIDEIVDSVKRVTLIVGEISTASTEQSTGIEQVNTAVIQMDQMTQHNAAMVEEASAAAQSLAEEAASLRDTVAVFTIA